jgi:tetratricopeptide (TPR) repeat protein
VQIFPLTPTILPLLFVLLLAGLAAAGQGAATGPVGTLPAASAHVTAKWQTIPPPDVPEPPSLIQTTLPDSGPRFDRAAGDLARLLFDQGVAAYEKRDIPEASARFEQFLREHPQHDCAPAARAFRAELMLLESTGYPRRIDVIEAYRVLGREGGSSGNGKRAAWRMGDLYRELGWYQESETAYQQALGRAESDSYDRSRAMVGLGFTLLGMKRWTDAHKTFELARKQTVDPHLAAHAAIGAGHALYRQGLVGEADQLYAMAYQRWGTVFRRQPYGLVRYANTSLALQHMQVARGLWLQFYNLFPSSAEAPDVLLQLADIYQHGKQIKEARLFYAAVATGYPAAEAGTIAQIRLIRMLGQRGDEAGIGTLPQAQAASLLLGLPLTSANFGDLPRWLEETASHYVDSRIGSEALFRLGEFKEEAGHVEEALQIYGRVVARTGRIEDDPWPDKTGARLRFLLESSLQAAVLSRHDLTTVTIFHRHGPRADQLYAGHRLLFAVAEAHTRLGFAIEAARLYQSIIRSPQSGDLLEPALIGLGKSYLDQQDPQAAQRVFERYRLQFPLGAQADQAFVLLLTSMAQQGKPGHVVRLGQRWLRNHARAGVRSAVLEQIGLALVERHRPEQALPVLAEAQRLGGLTTPDALATYGDVVSQAKQRDQAVALYRKSLSLNPSRDLAAWDHVQIARNFRDARKPDQARLALEALDTEDQPLFRRVAAVLEQDLAVSRKVERTRP